MMDPRVLALISALCFGVNPIVLKVGLRGASADIAVFIGLVAGLPILALIAPALGGFQFANLSGMALVYFALSGLFALFIGRNLLYLSIDRLGSARATAFKNAAPLFTAVLAVVFLRESIGLHRWAAIVLITAGLTLVGRMARKQAKAITLAGLVIAVLAALVYGIRPIFVKLGLAISPLPLTATLIGYLAALVLYLVYFGVTGRMKLMKTSPRSLLIFAAAGVLQSLGMLLLFYALQGEDVSLVYPIQASSPLLAFILSYTVLKNRERLTLGDLVGTLSVVSGVVLLVM